MRIRYVFIIGLLLSLITMSVLANRSEHGDINAISMYFVVFLIPVILMVILNTVFIWYLSRFKNLTIKIIFSFLPLCVFILFYLKGNLTIPSMDGNLVCCSNGSYSNWDYKLAMDPENLLTEDLKN